MTYLLCHSLSFSEPDIFPTIETNPILRLLPNLHRPRKAAGPAPEYSFDQIGSPLTLCRNAGSSGNRRRKVRHSRFHSCEQRTYKNRGRRTFRRHYILCKRCHHDHNQLYSQPWLFFPLPDRTAFETPFVLDLRKSAPGFLHFIHRSSEPSVARHLLNVSIRFLNFDSRRVTQDA
jgi:hypothetical protein